VLARRRRKDCCSGLIGRSRRPFGRRPSRPRIAPGIQPASRISERQSASGKLIFFGHDSRSHPGKYTGQDRSRGRGHSPLRLRTAADRLPSPLPQVSSGWVQPGHPQNARSTPEPLGYPGPARPTATASAPPRESAPDPDRPSCPGTPPRTAPIRLLLCYISFQWHLLFGWDAVLGPGRLLPARDCLLVRRAQASRTGHHTTYFHNFWPGRVVKRTGGRWQRKPQLGCRPDHGPERTAFQIFSTCPGRRQSRSCFHRRSDGIF